MNLVFCSSYFENKGLPSFGCLSSQVSKRYIGVPGQAREETTTIFLFKRGKERRLGKEAMLNPKKTKQRILAGQYNCRFETVICHRWFDEKNVKKILITLSLTVPVITEFLLPNA